MAKNLSSHMTQRRDGVELGQRASSRNGGAAQTRQVIVIGVRDALGYCERSQATQLARPSRFAQRRCKGLQVSSAHAADVELRTWQRAQYCLIRAREKVQALDRALAILLRFGEPGEVPLAPGGIVQCGKKLQVAAIAACENLAQIDPA